MGNKRFDIFMEAHFGLGVRWDSYGYPLRLSIAFPFVTIVIGIGPEDGVGGPHYAW